MLRVNDDGICQTGGKNLFLNESKFCYTALKSLMSITALTAVIHLADSLVHTKYHEVY